MTQKGLALTCVSQFEQFLGLSLIQQMILRSIRCCQWILGIKAANTSIIRQVRIPFSLSPLLK